MVLPESRRSYLETAISVRMRELDLNDPGQYYDFVRASEGQVEWTVLVDRLSVQETSFFRHKESCDFISRHIYDWYKEGRGRDRPLALWSAGCATGEEPYTMAIIAQEVKERVNDEQFYYGVTGSDISLPALSKARKGIYTKNRLRNCDYAMMQFYFNAMEKDEYQVKDDLKKRVCFVGANILDRKEKPVKEADVISCQNVLIYFSKHNKQKILENLVDSLLPGGVLLLGVGEVIGWEHPAVERVSSKTVLAYRKPAQ